jgi:hypothetical protein
MDYVVVYLILYGAVAVIFGVTTFLFTSIIGGVDFGPVGPFIAKSGVLVAIVAGVMFLPWGFGGSAS